MITIQLSEGQAHWLRYALIFAIGAHPEDANVKGLTSVLAQLDQSQVSEKTWNDDYLSPFPRVNQDSPHSPGPGDQVW